MGRALTDNPLDDEVTRFLRAHPDVEGVEYLLSDLNGVARGKWGPPQSLAKAATVGLNFPLSVFGLDVWGREVPDIGLHVETGDRDGYCPLAPGTLRLVPWARRPTAQAILTMLTEGGRPFEGDPRQQLRFAVDRLARLGLKAVAAFELEFYLLDPNAASPPDGGLASVFSGVGGPARENVYGLSDLAAYNDLFTEIRTAGMAQGLPVDTIVSEGAPGQFEVNLKHRGDAFAAADDAIMLRRLIVETARRHGLKATFMAKPFMDRNGNGMHVHVSLLDREGRNIFAAAGDGERRLGRSVAGLVEAMVASTLLFIPTWNGFRRLQPGSYAPTRASWGHNNRSVAVRVPASEPHARRVEHRLAGADANPYLVLAAVLNAMADGLEREANPPPPVDLNAYEAPVPALPATMDEAIRHFERSDFVRKAFGVEFRKLFATVKRAEMQAFLEEISPLERSTFL
ncbi:Gamma-glutamylputrescine synthetase PuuA [Hartmannibacter diazotrophicus]|uniref:Gamma-glutamylputrescine synthetase PuuA n=1 Tax=Hartmannibacter diazotrophicus TaxID=1482074 RepID=A0A2C9D2I2_9HYPH|nr:glutamine synthetase family protein [Hartmannibacter diazotrophicus]SON54476.1 Gamma-glutamylputrescine synthetase PuuA [Hartmannibacter diazotrophicus]